MKKVLVIGMVDSVHLYRWLNQFTDQDVLFTIFPSTKFRSAHPQLVNLVKKNNKFKFSRNRFFFLYGYIEYALNNFLSRIYQKFSNYRRLEKLIVNNEFDYIHALEIQGAGYLLVEALKSNFQINSKIIVTNWGSDIYFFENDPIQKENIKKILKIADFYSAECQRDYELASKNGFVGKFLPLNPNAGGFSSDIFQKNQKSSFDRNLIMAKCYGGKFGLGGLIIEAIAEYFKINKNFSIFFYSVTPDLEPSIDALIKKYPNRVEYSTVKNKLEINKMYDKFSNSIIYIGASRSDGISTSFLEALVLGAYPIQTNTSCGNEWVDKGFRAHMVESSTNAILDALLTLNDSNILEDSRLVNKDLAVKNLDSTIIKQDSLVFYSLVH
jgi:hypothetical protein